MAEGGCPTLDQHAVPVRPASRAPAPTRRCARSPEHPGRRSSPAKTRGGHASRRGDDPREHGLVMPPRFRAAHVHARPQLGRSPPPSESNPIALRTRSRGFPRCLVAGLVHGCARAWGRSRARAPKSVGAQRKRRWRGRDRRPVLDPRRQGETTKSPWWVVGKRLSNR